MDTQVNSKLLLNMLKFHNKLIAKNAQLPAAVITSLVYLNFQEPGTRGGGGGSGVETYGKILRLPHMPNTLVT